jgi:nucleoside-diphosphate-sugar epimerase
MKYAILGATGSVGKALAPLFAANGDQFRVVGRSSQRLRAEFQRYEPLVEYAAADLADVQRTRNAVRGADTVFYTAGVPYTQFELHPKLTRVALDAAVVEGVRRFVHVSTVYPYGRPESEPIDEAHPRNPHTFKGRMRKEQEELVFAADGRNDMRTAIVRPPDFYGPGAELSYVASIFQAAVNGGTANVIGPIDTPHEFIFVPDLARVLVGIAEKEEAYGQAWNVAGPGPITTRRFAEMVFAEVDRKPRLRVANKMILSLLGIFNPMMREIGEMHYLWTTPVILDDARLRRLFPELRKTSYEDGIHQTIAAIQSPSATVGRPN